MKTLKLLVIILFILSFNTAFSQQNNRSEVSKATDKVKQTNYETKDAVNTAKETLNEIGSIFKSKKKKSKNTVTITLSDVEYGNSDLNLLQKSISKAKGVKKSTKKYQNNIATFQIEYKESADALWQTLPSNIIDKFKIVSIAENNVSILLKSE